MWRIKIYIKQASYETLKLEQTIRQPDGDCSGNDVAIATSTVVHCLLA